MGSLNAKVHWNPRPSGRGGCQKGLRQGLLIALDAAGFTIIPAQPLKVIRHD